jgi:hypothetical protein
VVVADFKCLPISSDKKMSMGKEAPSHDFGIILMPWE